MCCGGGRGGGGGEGLRPRRSSGQSAGPPFSRTVRLQRNGIRPDTDAGYGAAERNHCKGEETFWRVLLVRAAIKA
eukprot:353454-Chlamydomonas_euryale.AAC.8